MRLLKREASGWLITAHKFSLVEVDAQKAPHYAILSHRWGPDEVTFKDIENGTAKTKAAGYKKLEFCAEQAARDGLLYFWVDTCCINKDSSAELSTAINSMFKWYQNATKCYVYLPDVHAGPDWESAFQQSEWFERGWTLQELLAPAVVEFYSAEGVQLGNKKSLEQYLHHVSGISIQVLQGKPLSQVDEGERFSWTQRRTTTVGEDAVYCLLGIFDVHMPLLYGEGQPKALIRLQREIRSAAKADLDVGPIKDVPWIVPFERNPLFTGRETQLAELEGKLFATDHSTSKVAITGLGGMGKTQLILELLYRTKAKYPACSIMWIAATSMESLQQGYLKVAQRLGIPGCVDGKVDIKQLVQDHLSKDAAGQWLLVFDNADDIVMWTTPQTTLEDRDGNGTSQGSSVNARRLIDYLPRSQHGCIVFTTRNGKAAVKFAQHNIVTVPEMSEQVAMELFKKSLTDVSLVDHSENVSTVLTALAHLPLAITQAAAYINANSITLVDYISLLQDNEEEAIEILSEDFEDYGRYQGVKNPVATTWLISFEQIRQSDPLAAEYLSFIACISPKDIPRTLLPPGSSRKKELDAIGTLTAYSLISWRSTDTTLGVHRLVHLATRNWLRKEEALSQWTKRSITHLDSVFPSDDDQNRSTWRLYLPHVICILASDFADRDDEERLDLMLRCGKCLYSDGRWIEAEAMFSDALAKAIEKFGEEARPTLTSKLWLAAAYLERGRREEAEQLQTQVMELRKKTLGPDHMDTLTSMKNLALTYGEQGRWEEAERLQVQVMEIYKTKLEPDHPFTLLSMHNLALTYQRQGWHEKAERLQIEVVEKEKRKLGSDHVSTLLSISNLAATYQWQGRCEEAEPLQIQVMEKTVTKLGLNHPNTLLSMYNLACTWNAMGRDIEATRLMQDCSQQRIRVLGVDHPDSSLTRAVLDEWRARSEHDHKDA